MEKLGAMIIGPGWVAEEHIKGYVRDPRTEIRAIVGFIEKDRAQAKHYIDKYNLTECEYTEDLDAALKRDDIQLASVTTINSMHHPNALAAIQAGKHVMVEKPLCHNIEQLTQLVEAVEDKGVYSHVGHVVRFYPAVVGLKNFIDSGAIGKVYYAESDYWHDIHGAWKVKTETGGSALCMGGCHSVDLIRWMIGEEHEAVEVAAFSEKAAWRDDFEYDPTISLIVKFDNGAIGRVSTSLECNMPYVFHIQVNGTDGTVRNNGMYSPKMYPGSTDFMSIPATYPDDWNVAHHPFPEEVGYFISAVADKQEGMLSIPRAAKTYELMFAAEQAARESAVVKLPLLKKRVAV